MYLVMKGSKNLFDINGGYSANTVNNEPHIKVESNKLITDKVQSGASCWAIFNKEYPAGTYTLCMDLETNDTSSQKNNYRFATSSANNVGTYLEYYKGWYKDVPAKTPITFTTTEPFRLSIFFIGVAGSQRTYYDIMLNEGVNALPYQPIGKTIVKAVKKSNNLFDVTKVGNTGGWNAIYVKGFNKYTGTIEIIAQDTSNYTNGYCTTAKTLSQLAPELKVGDICTLSAETESTKTHIYTNDIWNFGTTKTITQAMLDSTVILYGKTQAGQFTCNVSKIMLNKGETALPFEPYGVVKCKAFVKGDI